MGFGRFRGSPKPPRPGPRLGVQFFFFQAAANEGPVWVSGGFGGLPNRPGRGPGYSGNGVFVRRILHVQGGLGPPAANFCSFLLFFWGGGVPY